MISEKFESSAPTIFLEGIHFFKKLRLVHFICDFEYGESSPSGMCGLLCVGKFHQLGKKWKKQDNVEFLELHQQSQVSETLQNLHGRIEEFYFERIMEELDLLSQNSEIFENDESFLVSDDFRMLSKYFFSSMELEELVSMLNMEFKKKGGPLITIGLNPEDYASIEKIFFEDGVDITGRGCSFSWIPLLHSGKLAKLYFPKNFNRENFTEYYIVIFRILNHHKNQSYTDILKFEEPLVVLNENQDLYHSNEAFRKLNVEMKWLNNLENVELLTTNKENYLPVILDHMIDHSRLKVIVFIKIQNNCSEVLAQGNDEELGIICSSIAHELNNPIGGVLNAFQLLQVLNDYDQGTLDIINEMTKSINRAHRLVNLFLGFVKKDITRKENIEVERTLNQAVDLLRSRMIKEGVFIHLELINEGSGPKKSFNESILIIIFYILFNESLTAFARETLVRETSQDEKTLYLETIISENSILLRYININHLVGDPLSSHLLKYLLKSQDLDVEQKEMEIEFIWA